MQIKLLNKSPYEAPAHAEEHAAGVDLKANIQIPIVISPLGRAMVDTGLFMEIPEGHFGMVCPRSGLAAKHGITVTNAPGIIDSSYRGECKVILSNISNDDFTIMPGDRIAQLIIMKYEKVEKFVTVNSIEELSESKRGSGGFGSTGVN